MEKIASFQVNHDVLEKGMYVSRIDKDIITYDIRMAIPNKGPYLEMPHVHTFEHLFATYARNSKFTESIIYVGPMGCRTGFYFITRDEMSKQDALDLFREILQFISGFQGEIPGASTSAECGNYLEHDLEGARAIALDMIPVLKDWKTEDMIYKK